MKNGDNIDKRVGFMSLSILEKILLNQIIKYQHKPNSEYYYNKIIQYNKLNLYLNEGVYMD